MNDTMKQTAAEAYADRREDVARLLDWLALEMDKATAWADAGEVVDWGDVGSMGHAQDILVQALAALSCQDNEDIAELLAEAHRLDEGV